LGIVVPVAFLAVFDYVHRQIFDGDIRGALGVLVFYAIVAIGAALFSYVVFRIIDRLQRQVTDRNAQLSVLNEIATAASEKLELNELLEGALDKVLTVMRAEAGVICLLDQETDELVAACYRGFSDELAQRIRRAHVDDDPIGAQVVSTGCPVVVDDLLSDPRVEPIARREGFSSAVSVPLKSEGEVSGILAVVTRRERRFLPTEVELLSSIGGQLGLAVRNAILFARSQQRNEELAALLSVGQAAASSIDLAPMLERALDAIIAVTSTEVAEVWLLSDEGELTLERTRGAAEESFQGARTLRIGEGLPGQAVLADSVVAVHDLSNDPRFAREEAARLGFKTFCALPLRRGSRTVGVLAVAARSGEALCSTSELRLLEGIGEHVAMAIENARLHEQVLDVAVLEERERISRELHDGLGQVLGYINTQALAIRRLLRSGRTEEATREVIAIENAAKELYTDVRESILGLRISLAAQGGFVPALRTYLARYGEMTGVGVRLEVPDGPAPRLPASIEIQLLRIVQEALTNVRKHARTTRASVSLAYTDDGLTLTVADDGRGFDPALSVRRGWPRFGLQTMRERAEAIGGTFEIVSERAYGTMAMVRVPFERSAEAAHASAAG
jgi:signal transduction histidine kinase